MRPEVYTFFIRWWLLKVVLSIIIFFLVFDCLINCVSHKKINLNGVFY